MGSDLYMEERNFSPRPNKAQWELVDDVLELVIYRDVFYHGWEMIWHGPVTKDNESLIKAMVRKIPDRPKTIHSKRDQIAHLLEGRGPISEAEAVYLADQIVKIKDPDVPRMVTK